MPRRGPRSRRSRRRPEFRIIPWPAPAITLKRRSGGLNMLDRRRFPARAPPLNLGPHFAIRARDLSLGKWAAPGRSDPQSQTSARLPKRVADQGFTDVFDL